MGIPLGLSRGWLRTFRVWSAIQVAVGFSSPAEDGAADEEAIFSNWPWSAVTMLFLASSSAWSRRLLSWTVEMEILGVQRSSGGATFLLDSTVASRR